MINYCDSFKKKKKEKKIQAPKLKDQNPPLTLFGVPDTAGDENTFPFSHMLLILRTPSAGTGRSEAAGFRGFVVFVPWNVQIFFRGGADKFVLIKLRWACLPQHYHLKFIVIWKKSHLHQKFWGETTFRWPISLKYTKIPTSEDLPKMKWCLLLGHPWLWRWYFTSFPQQVSACMCAGPRARLWGYRTTQDSLLCALQWT